ncbi:MAG: aldehyde-activating protein [Alphaproteobacteria bacterium]|nr:aldehyde-activating protein [Alphaproteobacteria bacterium]
MAIDFKRLRLALAELSKMPAPFEGGCLCGAVRYRCEAAPLWSGHCHCNACKKLSGAPFTTAFTVRTEHFHALCGDILSFSRTTENGQGVRSRRCAGCGVWVWAERDARPDFRAVLATTLDDPRALPLVAHAYVSEALPWTPLDPALAHFQKMPEDELPAPRAQT